jgi:hypothetical protein
VKVPDHSAGKVVKCPKCQNPATVPAQADVANKPIAAPAAAPGEKRIQGRVKGEGGVAEYDLRIGAAPKAEDRAAANPAKQPVASGSGLLGKNIWLMRKRENIFSGYMRKRYNFFDGDSDTIVGHAEERQPISTLLLKGFELLQPFLKTKHEVRDEEENTLLFTVHVAGGWRNRKVLVEDGQGQFLWQMDFVRVSYIAGFPLLGDDKSTVATLSRGQLLSPDNKEWGRIAGEKAVTLQKNLAAGKRVMIEINPKTPGLYLAMAPAAANRPDIKILMLSAALTLEVVNIAYRF